LRLTRYLLTHMTNTIRRDKKGARYDVIVLALVLNFVGSAEQRGLMLVECARLLKPGGLLFLVLPEAAISNSRVSRSALISSAAGFCITHSIAHLPAVL
jgi:2-polyprenyl-3-methyl-5-hydroxy-6-metoxy-1,4-benzoquinol methylase